MRAFASTTNGNDNTLPSSNYHHGDQHHPHHPSALTASFEGAVGAIGPFIVASGTPKPSLTASLRSVFQRLPNRNSIHPLNTPAAAVKPPTAQVNPPAEYRPSHPYATMVSTPVPVVSSHDPSDEEDLCPICLESLSFSYRLPGEKPHIQPECGHALHEACFTAVYGKQNPSGPKISPGVCGVCRRPMKIGDGDGGKSNKLALLTGMGSMNDALFPGRDTPRSFDNRRAAIQNAARPYNPNEDDPVEHAAGSIRSGSSAEHQTNGSYIVAPSIQVRSEFPSLTRSGEASQPLTCIVVVELPGKRPNAHVPGSVMASQDQFMTRGGQSTSGHGYSASGLDFPVPRGGSRIDMHSPSPSMAGRARDMGSSYEPQGYGVVPSSSQEPLSRAPSQAHSDPLLEEDDEDSPFRGIAQDLQNRIVDWRGHPITGLGPLQMYDLLCVRRDQIVREFYVYLFREAIICVMEERKRSLGRFLSSEHLGSSGMSSSRGILRLKGRIYVRHIKRVVDTSTNSELSLTIDMEDERLDSFILIFKDRSSLQTWKDHINSLVAMIQARERGHAPQQPPPRVPDLEEFGGSSKAMRMLSGSTGTTVSTVDSLLQSSARSTMSSNTSHGSHMMRSSPQGQQAHQGQHQKFATLSTLEEDDEFGRYGSSSGHLVTPHMSSGPSNSLQPLPHPPMDLILVISVPPPNAVPSTANLKLRLIRTSLDFITASLGAKDRLSLVTFEVGAGGKVRKTPFLCLGKTQSRARLQKFVDELGKREEGFVDEFAVRVPSEEKTDVVTAVNHGLDVVLQRKSKNPISGMILVSDASDTTRRAQMDLVLARAEAANCPIHSFGYGRSHDPASLWLMSNHTNGTYTFVKDWYDLRDCLAGCIGGMMSIGLLSMKMHIRIVDGNRFRIRKISGGPSAILSSDGRDVDVDVGEVRYGERKEMLIELELDNGDALKRINAQSAQRSMSATDQFHQAMGFDALSISDAADLSDGMMDGMIDEVPVFEVDGAFFDPAAAKHVSRLGHPVLLTVTLLPSSSNGSRPPAPPNSDPVIVRRRMELLASDMITRALVLVSRKNFPQAQKLLDETRRILHTVLQTITQTLPPPAPGRDNGSTRGRKEAMTISAARAIQAVLQDMSILSEALEENVDLFAHDQRNFGAQQAMVLRDQKSWSGRSSIERLFWTSDHSIDLVTRSNDWVARE